MTNSITQFALETGNPYLMGAYAPVFDEIAVRDLPVEGEIPKDICGVYVRNGPNQRYTPASHYHWFDGDGMLHALHIENGKADYRNRWIRTDGFRREGAEGRTVWQGIMGNLGANPRGATYNLKDTANTAVACFNRKLLTMWYMCGDIYALDPVSLETLGKEDFQGSLSSKIMAHVKIDEHTNELMFFDYGLRPPFMWYGVVGADGRLKHFTEVPLPGPRLPHDMAITENYSVLMDLPYINDPEALKAGRSRIVFREDWPSRFGVIPRFGNSDEVRWFEAEPAYIYHVVNAWEQDDEIIMDACITTNPAPQSGVKGAVEKLKAYLRLEAVIYRYHFNLRDGSVREYPLDDRYTEFPMINAAMTGRKTRYAYNQSFDISDVLRFDGIIKYDTETGKTQEYSYGAGVFGSESPFIPKPGSVAEDDGYVITYVTDENSDTSEALLFHAGRVDDGPIARIKLPQRVPLGFHACWVDGSKI